ncbi:hypothetical protein OH76DRAFT_1481170 [Lentinus brumalis]|uniref:Uncharacterized protein n=1 Tax=Lentinus brumalis TaxID=2498619 RepID=A0A371DGI6_9APHY|nr:hypothetical protein OH76DRAFT_1481170 [Polyporus brumalis]
MPGYPRTDAHGRTVRFHDASRQRVSPADQQGPYVHFEPVQREHDFFSQDPPARGRWSEEPPSPHLSTRPLPSTPDLGGLQLTERGSPSHTPTPVNSPETRTAPLSRHTPSQAYPPPSPSPPSSPEPQSELPPSLAGPGLKWDVRRSDLVPSLRATHDLDRPAFTSNRKSCVLRFVVDGTTEWTHNLLPRTEASPLTIWEVLWAIRTSLFTRLERTALLPGEPRYLGAVEERPRRLHGQEDARADVFRNIDLYPADSKSYFHGLVKDEAAEKGVAQYLVKLGPRP